MKLVSTRWWVKALLTSHGACFGVEFGGKAYLLLVAPRNVVIVPRPIGDRVVEESGLDIGRIAIALRNERSAQGF
ncbi:MAG: hypothetical protein L3K15_06705 [Thermoplasmata archaeon]|nr:hypothetical protein [Thermoplasmata archaeon]